MTDISRIDPNFKVEPLGREDGLCFFDVALPPFSVHGLLREGGRWRRLPEGLAKQVSEGVFSLHDHTAGGRVRFVTDSGRIAIRAEMDNIGKMPHFALTGSAGFDLFEGSDYLTTFVPPFGIQEGFSSKKVLDGRKLRQLTLHFPLYSGVKTLQIGVEEGAVLLPAPAFDAPPIVFYGSSITQGGCASKPGSAFPAMVSAMLGCDHINLGFSGSCRGEPVLVDHLASLPMSAFVCGYDHNAPSVWHLKNTHRAVYEAVRAAHPRIPILLLNRPKPHLSAEEQERLAVIRATYDAAKAAGDENVFLLTGDRLIPEESWPWATVDGTHPNDLGFYTMAKAVAETLRAADFTCICAEKSV